MTIVTMSHSQSGDPHFTHFIKQSWEIAESRGAGVVYLVHRTQGDTAVGEVGDDPVQLEEA